jgi:hypothetical protein
VSVADLYQTAPPTNKASLGHAGPQKSLEAGGGIEPPIEDLQSPALPLCYPADSPTSAKPKATDRGRTWGTAVARVFYREPRTRSTPLVEAAEWPGFGQIRPDADCRMVSAPL